ncbi:MULTISPECIES: ABC transporter ATP-binding protein [unclassified Fusibacter]|uniref:ABC transporter ATP-binding protein n=1 Tax=unclassified Fusibacter TaxID=2624464 RepID=UPI0010131A3F|nr:MULTISPECIES: ABC transporter ATP-binding protein [unclassified Fusibacter]MCK8060943.1 ABC transporter ATP-binding protein/permease [Fusibacter sp. A2]NPE23239.1 ABC transporter ATP-binding protein [Fusibacter sp. A1]RXV59593.1 ABC transporter ATP-binding protein [Fusibacter sp. A1]
MSKSDDRAVNARMKGSGGGGGRHGMNMSGEKAKDFKGTIKRLVEYLHPYRIQFMIVFIFAMASATFGIAGPKLLGKATTKLFEGVMGQMTGSGVGFDFDYIGMIILTLVGLYGLSALFSYVQGFIMAGVAQKVSFNMRRNISLKINKMPLKYFDKTSHGEVLSRITNDVDTVSQTLNQSLSQIITSATTVVGVLIMMFSISWMMTIVALLIIPLSMFIVIFIVKKSQKFFKEQQKYLGNVNGHVEEMLSSHVVVKAFNGEKDSVEKFNGLNDQLYKSAWKAQFMSGIMMPVMNVVSNIGYVGVSVLGGALAARQLIEVGDIQAFIQYVRNFTQPLTQLANISNVLQQTAAAAERVFEFLDEKDEIAETTDPAPLDRIKGQVTFENVRFGYDEEKIIIKDFSAKIEPGQKVAIVGPTGAGKTTMVKLLMRFYDVSSGAILLDGHNIKDFRRGDLRHQFGMVLQDTWLYNGTIMENIRYGRLDATDEEVIEAAKAAHVDSFVHNLPMGYKMVLNEETSNISQGQKQLMTIARAILANPKLLILDEATSSVDTRTELQIQQAMDTLMSNRTSFIIAHRLSTIRNADVILVMDEGDIVEQGTHLELLAKQGFYANLYNSQFDVSA